MNEGDRKRGRVSEGDRKRGRVREGRMEGGERKGQGGRDGGKERQE